MPEPMVLNKQGRFQIDKAFTPARFMTGSACPCHQCTMFTISAEYDCECGYPSPGPIEIEISESGTYRIVYMSGAVRARNTLNWNRHLDADCASCGSGYTCWQPYIQDENSNKTALTGFNATGWSTAAAAEAASADGYVEIYLQAGTLSVWYNDDGCADNEGNVTYGIYRVS